MANLIREPLTADNHPVVRSFSCGTEGDWCKRCDEWIKAAPDAGKGAFDSMQRHGTSVWLYFDDVTDDLVAFGSIGEFSISWPKPHNARQQCSYIPQLAVDCRYHGMPEPPDEKYSHQLLEDLLAQAQDLDHDKLILHVAPDNGAAINLYQKYEFIVLPQHRDNHGNQIMLRWMK